MKRLTGIGLITVALLLVVAVAFAQVWVRPHVRRDGTVVEGHWRSSPNSTTRDNWSTRGNVNPFTGERGTRDPDDDRQSTTSRRDRSSSGLFDSRSDSRRSSPGLFDLRRSPSLLDPEDEEDEE